MHVKTRTLIGIGVALATATTAAVTVGATTGGPTDPSPSRDTATRPKDTPPQRPTERRRIASSVLGRDYTFTLTALRSKADPLAASLQLRVLTRHDGKWKESDRVTVGDPNGFFWFPLTGRHVVCEFSTSSSEPAPVAVSVLITPSIGCSPIENFEVRNGKIVSG